MIVEQYFEDYEVVYERRKFGRTITETDFVVHAGHSGDLFPHRPELQPERLHDSFLGAEAGREVQSGTGSGRGICPFSFREDPLGQARCAGDRPLQTLDLQQVDADAFHGSATLYIGAFLGTCTS